MTQLSQLDEAERYRHFDDLQLAMPSVWASMQLGLEDESVVVVPSISIERRTAGSGNQGGERKDYEGELAAGHERLRSG